MDDQTKLVWGAVAIGSLALIVAANAVAPPRYTMIGTGNGSAYRVDRHSGQVTFCMGFRCWPVTQESEVDRAAARTGGSDGDPATSWAEEYLERQRAKELEANSN